MEAKKVKELKDDVILNIKVNKTFYLMSKSALLAILGQIYEKEKGSVDEFIKGILSKKYEELDDKQRTFYTLSLLVGEIEKQALENEAYVEKEIDPDKLKQDLEKAEESSKD